MGPPELESVMDRAFRDPCCREPHWKCGKVGCMSHHERVLHANHQRSVAASTLYKSRPRSCSKFWDCKALVVLFIAVSSFFETAFAGATHSIWPRASLAPQVHLLIDRGEPPVPRMRLVRRQDETSSTSELPSSIRPTATGTTTEETPVTTIVLDESDAESSPLPEPFDTSIGNNFTSTSCPTFFDRFLSNQNFDACLPFSLLLQTSDSFFTASRSLVRVTLTLDATCNVDFQRCNSLMGSLAQELTAEENCGLDFQNQNPVVMQAYNGFIAYEPLYLAGCLRDERGNYCFANAVTNTSSNTDSYPYYLPLGVSLPAGGRPTCNTCLQDTMAIFANAAANSTQPLSQTYPSAAQQVGIGCGPNFVNSSVPVQSGGSLGFRGSPGLGSSVALVFTLFALFF